MNKKLLSFLAAGILAAVPAGAETIDWDKIEHWTGNGPNKAALVVQFQTDDNQDNPGAIVWGFRWADGEKPSGEDMVRAVAAASPDIVLLTQYTGDMGNTVCGLGYAPDIANLIANLNYDFDGACSMAYPAEGFNISFGFFEPNTSMGQTSAPGGDTSDLVYEAITAAEETHIIEHPLNAEAFGYAAYDYDWWLLDRDATNKPDKSYWNAGWYKGYWSYWTGYADFDTLSYSGLGMSSVELEDGMVTGWKYWPINDGGSEDPTPWLAPNYAHFSEMAGMEEQVAVTGRTIQYYRLDGTKVCGDLTPGLYIKRQGSSTSKIIIH